MRERIRHLLLAEGLTSGAFADEIGVQRSSVSHILNGRNNPSLDFVVKTKARFPRLSLAWLIMGEGDMYPDKDAYTSVNSPVSGSPTIFQAFTDNLAGEKYENLEQVPEKEIIREDKASRKVTQIVIFYDDLSFDAYHSKI